MPDDPREAQRSRSAEVRQFIADTAARRRDLLIPDPDRLTGEDVTILRSLGIKPPERTDE